MDFLQASIDAALKCTENAEFPDDENMLDDSLYDSESFNGFALDDNLSFGERSPENLNDDDQPPILEENGFNDSALSTISQVLTSVNNNNNSPLPASARAYQEEVISLEKCKFNGNRLLIENCKYEFVRLNVRANVYFRCVVCYGIYQRRRALVTKSGVQVEVPSVGSLKLVSSTGEIRGNPDQPSGIPHCCEVEKYRDCNDDEIKREIKRSEVAKKDSTSSTIDPLSLINSVIPNGNSGMNGHHNTSSSVDDEEVVPNEKCKFMDKRLEIEGCKYVFSRTQSGPRDYYRCTACIALYHKRHFRKLPTPKIGSLSLVRETGVLTGNPEMPRGLPHICDNFELHCAPARPDISKPKFRQPPPALAGIYEAAKQKWHNNSSSPTTTAASTLSNSRPSPTFNSSLFKSSLTSNLSNGSQKRQNDLGPPASKFRKILEEVMGPSQPPSLKLNYNPTSSSASAASPPSLKHGSTGSSKLEDEELEYKYPHTNDLQTAPNKMLPDYDLSFLQRFELLSQCFNQFPKFPNQGKFYIFTDTILKQFDPKNLNPSASIVRVEFPLTPTHLVFDLFRKAKDERDCFSKTKHVFFVLGYDVIRCIDVDSLSRRINVVQNEFFQMREFFDKIYEQREIILSFVTVPEMGVLADEIRAFNHGMKTLILSKKRKDMIICDWASEYSTSASSLSNVEDRIHILMEQMSAQCGAEILDED
jgi:hypothetical protein